MDDDKSKDIKDTEETKPTNEDDDNSEITKEDIKTEENIEKNKKVKRKNSFYLNENTKEKIKKVTKTKVFKVFTYIFVFIFGVILTTPSESPSMTNEEIDNIISENNSYEEELATYKEELKEANNTIDKLNEKVESAQPWFEMEENEKEKIEKANKEKRLAEEAEAKKKAEEEQKAKEAEEKKEYDTGITYSQLARTPDEYVGEKIKFNGKVLQVMESDETVQIRLAVGGNYDNVILCEYTSSIVTSRVLEDDNVTVYGLSTGLITYTSTLGGEITIPSMIVDKIDQ